jgi:hypothetical protein
MKIFTITVTTETQYMDWAGRYRDAYHETLRGFTPAYLQCSVGCGQK